MTNALQHIASLAACPPKQELDPPRLRLFALAGSTEFTIDRVDPTLTILYVTWKNKPYRIDLVYNRMLSLALTKLCSTKQLKPESLKGVIVHVDRDGYGGNYSRHLYDVSFTLPEPKKEPQHDVHDGSLVHPLDNLDVKGSTSG